MSLPKTKPDQTVYPVYILKRVVDQLIDYCKEEAPVEALGLLIGWHYQLPEPNNNIRFTKIVDWVTGESDASHVGAQFTEKGIMEYNMLLDEKYGQDRPNGPFNLGIFHSHPFGVEPHFSSTDFSTFLVFPYNAERNVFILIDPVPDLPYFKVFQLQYLEGKLKLVQVPWVEFSPISKDFDSYTVLKKTIIGSEKETNEPDKNNQAYEDPIFHPPKIEDYKNSTDSKKTSEKKTSLHDYF